jgi:beta-aspartyl-peptidase (threonine type)
MSSCTRHSPNALPWVTLLASLAAIAVGGCLRPQSWEKDRERIIALLTEQDAAWNAGDLEAFMDPYWKSPDLTFSAGGKVTRGWQPTMDRYRGRYPNREAMGRLTFSELELTPLGRDAALVLGRWNLDRAEPIQGNFTLVLRREKGRWVIIHDHTSSDSP